MKGALEADRRAQESDRMAMSAEAKIWGFEGRTQKAERRTELLEQKKPLERCKQETSIAIRRGGNEGAKKWLVGRRYIHMTGDRIGGGGWGNVIVTEFRGS